MNDPSSPAAVFLFDGACGICSWLAQRAAARDRRGRFRFVPFQDVSEEELLRSCLSRRACSRRLYVVVSRKNGSGRHGGAFAVNYYLWRQAWGAPLVALLYLLPVLLLLEILIYELVARQRGRISHLLGLQGCAVR